MVDITCRRCCLHRHVTWVEILKKKEQKNASTIKKRKIKYIKLMPKLCEQHRRTKRKRTNVLLSMNKLSVIYNEYITTHGTAVYIILKLHSPLKRVCLHSKMLNVVAHVFLLYISLQTNSLT